MNLKRRVAGLQAEVAAARFGELGAARAVAAAAELGIAEYDLRRAKKLRGLKF